METWKGVSGWHNKNDFSLKKWDFVFCQKSARGLDKMEEREKKTFWTNTAWGQKKDPNVEKIFFFTLEMTFRNFRFIIISFQFKIIYLGLAERNATHTRAHTRAHTLTHTRRANNNNNKIQLSLTRRAKSQPWMVTNKVIEKRVFHIFCRIININIFSREKRGSSVSFESLKDRTEKSLKIFEAWPDFITWQ